MKPHKHAELIKQWADNPSICIEFRVTDEAEWTITAFPNWKESLQYRVRPKKRSLGELLGDAAEAVSDPFQADYHHRVATLFLKFLKEEGYDI